MAARDFFYQIKKIVIVSNLLLLCNASMNEADC